MRFVIFILLLISVISFSLADENKIESIVLEELEENGNVDVIVKYKDEVGIFSSINVNVEDVMYDVPEFRAKNKIENLNLISGNVDLETLQALEESKFVEEINLDYPIKAFLTDGIRLVNSSVVNPLRVDGVNLTGIDQTVCIIDTGVNYNLAALGGGLGSGYRVVSGYDFVNSDNNPMDDHGHGTHVAGIVGGTSTVTGVAPNVTIAAIKVLNSGGGGSVSNLLLGLQWCIDNRTQFNISVITMSLGCQNFNSYCDDSSTCGSDSLASVVNDAVGKNISVIASTGNDASVTTMASPACLRNVTSVGATSKTDGFYSDGNRNNMTKLFAPGTSIISLGLSSGTSTLSGTSMAAPFVAGAHALMNQYLKIENNTIYTPIQLQNLFNVTGRQLNDTTSGYNYSRIDIYAALESLDSENPSLNYTSPLNQTYYQRTIDLNYTAFDVLLDRVFYDFNSTNTSLTANSTISFSGGSNTIVLYANDTNNHLNSSVINFNVNTTHPQVTSDSVTSSVNNVSLNCTSVDFSALSNVTLYHNISGSFVVNETRSLSGEKNFTSFDLSFKSDKIFMWNCLLTDTSNNQDWGNSNITINVDINEAPNITSYTPTNLTSSVNESSSLAFTHVSSDPESNAISYAWFINGVQNVTTQNFTYNPSYSDSGNRNITLIVNDSALFDSQEWNISVLDVIACGNGVNETGEECDGSDFSGNTCSTYGFSSGSLTCTSCVVSTSSCTVAASGSGSGGGGGGGGGGSGSSETPVVNTPKPKSSFDNFVGLLAASDDEQDLETNEETNEQIEDIPVRVRGEGLLTGLSVYTKTKGAKFGLGFAGGLIILGLFVLSRKLVVKKKR